MDYCGKMATILHMAFWNTFSWMQTYSFSLKFHWDLLPRVHLTMTMSQHGFREWPGTEPVTSHYLNQQWSGLVTYTCVAWPMWDNQKCTSYWGWQRQSAALTHLHLGREAHPAWYMDTDPCIIPTDPCWMPLRGILCGPLLRPPGLWPAVAMGYL